MKGKIFRPSDTRFFDWNCDTFKQCPIVNKIQKPTLKQLINVQIDDESLRDGLGGVIKFPSYNERKKYIDLAVKLGMKVITIGVFSGTGSREHVIINKLLRYLSIQYPKVHPVILSRALKLDVEWAVSCHKLNSNLQVIIYQGSSVPRMIVQNWTKSEVLENLGKGIKLAKKNNLFVISATEDTTRTEPEFLEKIIKTSVENGADRFCVSDTVGASDAWGSYRIVDFVRNMLNKYQGNHVSIDFHGHRDRGMGLSNALSAIAGGANRIHGVILGFGERSGNTDLGLLMYNIEQLIENYGEDKKIWNLKYLQKITNLYVNMTGMNIPTHSPLVGKNAFTTQAGIHSDAEHKALKMASEYKKQGDLESADFYNKMARIIYTSVEPLKVGRKHTWVLSPISGKSTVKRWLEEHNLNYFKNTKVESLILRYAKKSKKILNDNDVINFINSIS